MHTCDSPCMGEIDHYGPCCCDRAHLWEDPEHGMHEHAHSTTSDKS